MGERLRQPTYHDCTDYVRLRRARLLARQADQFESPAHESELFRHRRVEARLLDASALEHEAQQAGDQLPGRLLVPAQGWGLGWGLGLGLGLGLVLVLVLVLGLG